jgi:glutathione S-transferase
VFERYFRVHQNTLEMLAVFLPGLALFALYVDARWAALLGVVYLVGRTVYFLAYVRDPAKREFGFALTALPILAMLIGALVAVVARLVGA